MDANCVNLDHQKPSDLGSQDLHCFQKKVYIVEKVECTMQVLLKFGLVLFERYVSDFCT